MEYWVLKAKLFTKEPLVGFEERDRIFFGTSLLQHSTTPVFSTPPLQHSNRLGAQQLARHHGRRLPDLMDFFLRLIFELIKLVER
jgi:hypothetical protein